MAFVVFSLFNVIIALSARSETGSAFNRDIFHDRNQLMLYGLALLFIFVPVELGLPRFLGLTRLTGDQWLICIVFAIVLLLVDEVIKFFLRRRRGHAAATPATVTPAQA
jgi:Ca2+-transporting ATPase